MIEEFSLQLDFVDFAAYSCADEKSRAVLCVIHGAGEHFGRHAEFAERLRGAGFAVLGLDLMGHGKSPGIRGQIGSRAEVMAQIDVLINYARENYPGLPLFLMGHSMGGNIVLSYRYYNPGSDITAYAVTSPLLVMKEPPKTAELLKIKFMAAFFPKYMIYNGRIKPDLMFRLEPGQNPPPQDILLHLFVSPRAVITCMKDAELIIENAGMKAPPVYLIHGESDALCAPEGSRMFKRGAGELCTYREYPGLLHDTMHESGWESRADEMIAWFNNYIADGNI